MRLTCPNCGAQYEVPDDIIPTSGRDVQCSNCGNTWFQAHPDDIEPAIEAQEEAFDDAAQATDAAASAEVPESEEDVFTEVEPPELSISDEAVSDDFFDDTDDDSDDLDLGGDDWDLEPEQDWASDSAVGSETAAALATFGEDDEAPIETAAPKEDLADLETDAPAEASDAFAEETAPDIADEAEDDESTGGPRQRRGLDAAVADILREEAELETQARAADAPQSLETQGDLGLDDGVDAPRADVADAAASRLRRLRSADDDKAAKSIPTPKETRRDLLPDIEEINSTLRSSTAPQRNPDLGQGKDSRAKRGRGFRLGFALVLLLAVAAVFVYSSNDMLSQNYPAAAPYIEMFMTSANGARVWLDDQMTQLFLKLDQMTG
ncbi:zinc-ribbon domain-containing protein [Shimia sp. NS0008-38b]|uniref:zinc-ribbon domain-containing protein n=1 Tax=Shimia sp. NS0008-38b TaxID=3127653 RepID=UPI00310C545C